MTEMKKRRIIVLNEDVLYEKELTLAEKFVYARIAGFEEYFESADECAKLLGISASTVQKAKSKLEKLGYIICIRNTGRGKAYRAALDRQCEPDSQNLRIRLANSANQTSKFREHSNDIDTNIDLSTYVDKGASAAGETVSKSNSQKVTQKAEPDSKPSYGNSSINSMFGYWRQCVGTPIISREKGNRRACYNLLRNKHIGEEKLRHAIEFVGKIKEDRFAPRISDFVDLQSKFNALCDYKNRRDQQTPTANANDAYKRNGEPTRAFNKAGGAVPFVPSTHDARQDDYEAEQRRWVEAERNRADDEFVQKMYDETMSKLKGSRR